MKHKKTLQLFLVIMGLFGLVALDHGPLVSLSYAQRPNDNDDDDDDEGGDRRRGRGRGGFGGGEWGGGRGRGGRGFGREGEGGGERPRRRDNDDDGGEDRPNRDSGGDSRPSMTEFAQERVKMLDKNGNNMLEGEELEGLRGPEARADANGDKTITVAEIVAAISNRNGASNSQRAGDRNRRRESEAGNTSSDKASTADSNASKVYLGLAAVMSALSDEKAKNDEAKNRKTYRFTLADERLPSGLPSWFKSRDRNKDGQVSMNEYRSSWSASAVRDFGRIDVNNDGVITPKEASDD